MAGSRVQRCLKLWTIVNFSFPKIKMLSCLNKHHGLLSYIKIHEIMPTCRRMCSYHINSSYTLKKLGKIFWAMLVKVFTLLGKRNAKLTDQLLVKWLCESFYPTWLNVPPIHKAQSIGVMLVSSQPHSSYNNCSCFWIFTFTVNRVQKVYFHCGKFC